MCTGLVTGKDIPNDAEVLDALGVLEDNTLGGEQDHKVEEEGDDDAGVRDEVGVLGVRDAEVHDAVVHDEEDVLGDHGGVGHDDDVRAV